ncbi:hypothetical protein ACLIMJ_27785 [Pseudomonas veronii]|jgi:hypothetical protein|uniref:hypothetical protein n=1 Tax=Pseudomonas veronii TaxID=76761 RepID=UPI002FA585B9
MSALDDYRSALQRLIDGKTQIVPKGSSINKDTVALEAGRKRGSIKKSRDEHADIIFELEAAAAAQLERPKSTPAQEIEKQKALKQVVRNELKSLKDDYELALNKIVCLAHENHILNKRIDELTKGKQRDYNKIIRIE